MVVEGSNRVGADSRAKAAKPSCETCFFGCRMLCALNLDAPCTTYRADHPEGLMPPVQPTLLVNAEADPLVGLPQPGQRMPVFVEVAPAQLDLLALASA